MTTQWPGDSRPGPGDPRGGGRGSGGQPPYGAAPSRASQSAYGSQPYGSQPYGSPPHGAQPRYGSPSQPQQGRGYPAQPSHGRPGPGALQRPAGDQAQHLHQHFLAPAPPSRRTNVGMIIVTVVLGVLAAGVIAFFLVLFWAQGAIDFALGSLLLALLPISFVWLIVWFIDRWEPEPPGYLLGAVFWGGGVAVLGAFGLGMLSDAMRSPSMSETQVAFLGAVIEAPLHEEFMKGLGLLVIYFAARRHLSSPVDGVVYGALIGAGFAFTENLLYFTSQWAQGGVGAVTVQFFFRGIALPLLHPICVSFTGAAVGWASRRWGPGRVLLAWLLGLLPGMLLHGTWNAISTFSSPPYAETEAQALSTLALGFFGLMLPAFIVWIIFVVSLRRGEARIVRERLGEYSRAGWYSPGEVEMLSTSRGRSSARRWARRLSPEMGRAMNEFISESTHLAVVRNRLLHGGGAVSKQTADEAETLQILTGLRRRLNAAQSAYAVPR